MVIGVASYNFNYQIIDKDIKRNVLHIETN